MKVRLLSAAVFALVFGISALAQDAPTPPPAGQAPAQGNGSGRWQGQGQGQGQGQRGGGGRGMGGGMGMGRGVMGTVTEVTADHYTIKTDAGETYTVHYSANTRIVRQSVQSRGQGGGQGQGQGQGRARGNGGGDGGPGGGANPPEMIKATDIKVGDAIGAMGEVDSTAKSVGAVVIAQMDPERAKQMREMQANYGKTWLMGKITAVDGVKVTLVGTVDNAAHSFVADENTTFRKRRDPITLADLAVGDNVRVEGAVKDGVFLATTVNAMGAQQGGDATVPRGAPRQ